MTPAAIDAYLRRLADELRQRGLDDPRMMDEARAHLVDAFEDGRQRGLSVEDAAGEAFERFGAPETVAAYVVPERDRIMNRIAAVLETMWHRKWWILAPTVLTAVVTSVLSYYFLPPRYRSESFIRIMSSRLPAGYVPPLPTAGSRARFELVSQIVLSRTRLEGVIKDFHLHQGEEGAALVDLVQRVRRDITVTLASPDRGPENEVGGFYVSFVSGDPKIAQGITQRLAMMIVQENLREREVQDEGTFRFIEGQIAEVRQRIVAAEQSLEEMRRKNGGQPLSRADLLPYEVLQERYKALLIQSEESRTAVALQRRQLGEQFVVAEGARIPERPVGPSRVSVNTAGTLAGLALGLVCVGLRRTKN